MSISRGMWKLGFAAVVATGLAVGGCENQQRKPDAPAAPAAPAKAEVKPDAKPAPVVGNSNVQYYPNGRRDGAAVSVEKTAPAEVAAGAPFDYVLKVTNLSGSRLENVVITDVMDGNFKMSGSDPKGSYDAGTRTLSVLVGGMNAGETRSVTIAGSAGGTGILTNCCGVTYALPLCVQTRVVQPALAITKQITPESILNCDTITMTIEVKNTGSGNASNVHILDTLPAGLTTMDGKSSIDVPLGNLASGQSRPVTMQLKASKTGRYENMASATADGNLKADSGKVVTVVKQPVLAIDCKPGAERVVLGRDATFCFTVRNTGDAVSAETRVVATLPAGASFVSADNGGAASAGAVTWNVGALPPGQTKTLCVTVKPASASAVALSATAQGKCAAQVSTTCQTNVIGIPAMLLDGSDEPDPVQIGGTTTYTLTITNQGFADLTNVSLVCTLDDAKVMQYVSSSSGGSANGTTVTFPTIAVLKPKEKRTYTITVKAVGEGQVQMKAEAKSTEITRTLIKTETTNFYK